MGWIEASGKTYEEAVAAAAEQLGVAVDQVQSEVLDEGSKGLFGLGHADVKIKAAVVGTPAEQPAEVVPSEGRTTEVMVLVKRILAAMDFNAEPALVSENEEEIVIDIRGDSEDTGRLIGHHGQTLDALQYLVAVAVNRRDMIRLRVILDAEGYRDRHQKMLETKARELADAVKAEGEEAVLEPQSARDRRIVHMALADDPDVMTYSEGEGEERHIVITPRK